MFLCFEFLLKINQIGKNVYFLFFIWQKLFILVEKSLFRLENNQKIWTQNAFKFVTILMKFHEGFNY